MEYLLLGLFSCNGMLDDVPASWALHTITSLASDYTLLLTAWVIEIKCLRISGINSLTNFIT